VGKELYTIGTINYHSNEHLAVEVIGQVWVMISCSQVSGQMSFKNENYPPGCLRKMEDKDEDWPKEHGISQEGHILEIKARETQSVVSEKVSAAMVALGFVKEMKNPFVSIQQKLPLISDGKHGFEVVWPLTGEHSVTFKKAPGHKCYRVQNDPVLLAYGGELLVEVPQVIARIDENFVQFADPFSTKNTGHVNHNEVKTIGGSDRIQMRKRTRKAK
jgi:hypothetical protein